MKYVRLYYEKYGLILLVGIFLIFFIVLFRSQAHGHVDLIDPSIAIETVYQESIENIELQLEPNEDGAYEV